MREILEYWDIEDPGQFTITNPNINAGKLDHGANRVLSDSMDVDVQLEQEMVQSEQDLAEGLEKLISGNADGDADQGLPDLDPQQTAKLQALQRTLQQQHLERNPRYVLACQFNQFRPGPTGGINGDKQMQ